MAVVPLPCGVNLSVCVDTHSSIRIVQIWGGDGNRTTDSNFNAKKSSLKEYLPLKLVGTSKKRT